jgi:hypothetical protein
MSLESACTSQELSPAVHSAAKIHLWPVSLVTLGEDGEASVSVHPSGVAPRATMRRAGKARD